MIAARRAFGDALLERFPFDAYVSKTITLEPRQGNPPPRLWETPAGMINSIGLPNKGLEGFLAEDLPQIAEVPVPVVVSVMGFSRDELATLVEAVGARDEVALIELNVSCPNVETGLIMGADPDETAARGGAPAPPHRQAADREAHAERHRSERGGARRRGGRRRRRVAREHPEGHGAAPADRRSRGSGGAPAASRAPRSARSPWSRSPRCRAAVDMPVIGMGGIASGRDAADFMAAGAAVIAVGTENFLDPAAGRRIGDELAAIGAVEPPAEAKSVR